MLPKLKLKETLPTSLPFVLPELRGLSFYTLKSTQKSILTSSLKSTPKVTLWHFSRAIRGHMQSKCNWTWIQEVTAKKVCIWEGRTFWKHGRFAGDQMPPGAVAVIVAAVIAETRRGYILSKTVLHCIAQPITMQRRCIGYCLSFMVLPIAIKKCSPMIQLWLRPCCTTLIQKKVVAEQRVVGFWEGWAHWSAGRLEFSEWACLQWSMFAHPTLHRYSIRTRLYVNEEEADISRNGYVCLRMWPTFHLPRSFSVRLSTDAPCKYLPNTHSFRDHHSPHSLQQ